MPKLPAAAQEAAESAESMSFDPIPDGVYTAKLTEVDDSVAPGPAGPQWKLTWEVTDEEYKGRKLFERMSLSKAAAFKVKEIYEALGYTLDSDTDEMIGDQCKLAVSIGIIEKGTRKGEKSNNIDRHMSLSNGGDSETSGPAAASAAAGGSDPWS